MGLFRKRIPTQRAGQDEPTEADRAVAESAQSVRRNKSRWDAVHGASSTLTWQLETNHLAERLEAAMHLKGRQS